MTKYNLFHWRFLEEKTRMVVSDRIPIVQFVCFFFVSGLKKHHDIKLCDQKVKISSLTESGLKDARVSADVSYKAV